PAGRRPRSRCVSAVTIGRRAGVRGHSGVASGECRRRPIRIWASAIAVPVRRSDAGRAEWSGRYGACGGDWSRHHGARRVDGRGNRRPEPERAAGPVAMAVAVRLCGRADVVSGKDLAFPIGVRLRSRCVSAVTIGRRAGVRGDSGIRPGECPGGPKGPRASAIAVPRSECLRCRWRDAGEGAEGRGRKQRRRQSISHGHGLQSICPQAAPANAQLDLGRARGPSLMLKRWNATLCSRRRTTGETWKSTAAPLRINGPTSPGNIWFRTEAQRLIARTRERPSSADWMGSGLTLLAWVRPKYAETPRDGPFRRRPGSSRRRSWTMSRVGLASKAKNGGAHEAPMEAGVVATLIPARLERLPWGRFHLLVVVALGVTWILDGLEVTLAGSVAGALKLTP